MAEVVVDGFEVVDVEEKDRERELVAEREGELNLKMVVEEAAIVEAGEVVCDGEFEEELVGLLELGFG